MGEKRRQKAEVQRARTENVEVQQDGDPISFRTAEYRIMNFECRGNFRGTRKRHASDFDIHDSAFDILRFALRTSVFGLLLIVYILPGCTPSNRHAVQGTVTLDDQPIEKGTITFRPLAGTEGPTSGSEIVDGNYSISAEQGIFAGEFRVEITADRDTGRTWTDPDRGTVFPVYEQYLPARYNQQSELTAEITAGDDNSLDFTLTSG